MCYKNALCIKIPPCLEKTVMIGGDFGRESYFQKKKRNNTKEIFSFKVCGKNYTSKIFLEKYFKNCC